MENFVKAHSSRKQSKTEKTVKKQLKQMLHGYTQSDNELIKRSANLENELNESSSVSGFSDLNLTNSSVEGDVTQETVNSDSNNVSLPDFKELNLSKSPDITKDDDSDHNDSGSDNIESISKRNESNETVSEDILKEITENSSLSGEEASETPLDTSIMQTDDDTDGQAGSFDADGALAARILKRLGKAEKTPLIKDKKGKKRKLSTKDRSNESLIEEVKYKGPYNPKKAEGSDLNDVENDTDSDSLIREGSDPSSPQESDSGQSTTDEESSDFSDHDSLEQSPAFISITATDMLNESFDDILGIYKHPTTRNLPSESQNIFIGCDMFSAGDISVADLHLKEDIDSSVAKVDKKDTVDDIDLDSKLNVTESTQPNDESTVYNDTFKSDQTEKDSSTESLVPPFINRVKIYYGKDNCILVMKHPAEIYINGKVKITALGGRIEVLGYTLQDKPCEVYAPNYNFAQYIRTVQNDNACYGLFGKLSSAGLTVSEAEEIVTTLGENDGVVSLQPLKSQKLDFVECNFKATDLFSKINKNIDGCLKKAADVLRCSLYLTNPWKCFRENASWKPVINCGLGTSSRGIICGGKGTGKSTFLRYYINKLLASGPVLLIDLDPGQCELTVAGNVSATVITKPLLGPNFTHLQTPDITLNLGMINTMDNPKRYANAVQTLLAHCSNDERLSKLPWIVNTMGMCNDMGLKLISLIILRTKPTFLLQIDSKNAKRRFDCHLYAHTIKQIFRDYQNNYMFRNIDITDVENIDYKFFMSHHTENSVTNKISLAPRDERYLNFLAYFGELLNSKNDNLLGIVPYEVSLKDLSIGANVKIAEAALAQVINGKVVALCQRALDSRVFALADNPLRCYGHGLIRGIDWEKEMVYVITPTLAENLAAVNTLVYADWVPELRGQEILLPPGTTVPYRTASQYEQRQLMFAPKRRFNPLQLLKMSRNS